MSAYLNQNEYFLVSHQGRVYPRWVLTFPVPPTNPEHARWFAEEIQPHEAHLRAYLHGRFPRLRSDVDDLVQEAYIRIFRAKQAGKQGISRAYLFVIARNAALAIFRRRKSVTMDGIADIEGLGVVEDKPDAAESTSHVQELEILADAVNALPDRCREIFALRRFEGLSHQEIADRLGITQNTVNATLVTGMSKVRIYLREHGVTHVLSNGNERL